MSVKNKIKLRANNCSYIIFSCTLKVSTFHLACKGLATATKVFK